LKSKEKKKLKSSKNLEGEAFTREKETYSLNTMLFSEGNQGILI